MKMYQVSICPDDKILNINCATIDAAKKEAKRYYPEACFTEISSDGATAIYERFELPVDKMAHVGNIWPIKN
jgi:hypothetical protein